MYSKHYDVAYLTMVGEIRHSHETLKIKEDASVDTAV